MKPLKLASLFLAGAVGLSACADGTSVSPLTPDSRAASAAAVAGGTGKYMIIGALESFPADLAARVAAAGGTLEQVIPEIGVAFASATDAGFASALASSDGIESVVADRVIQFYDPNPVLAPAEVEAAEVLNQAAGYGESDTF